MTTLAQITVPFHGSELFVIEHNNQPYTPMKPIVEGMGMDWAAQFNKLKQKFASTIAEITMVANDGKERLMLCLPVRKLAAWLYSISPNKVRPELRDTVIMYQNECDDVLWDYWTKGQATNPRSFAKTHKEEREPLTNAVNMLVAKTKHLSYSDAYKLVHQRFNVKHIDEIVFDVIPIAVEYVHHLIALYSNAERQVFTSADLQNVHALASHMIWVMEWWRTFGDAIRVLSPVMAGSVHHHFIDGSSIAWRYIDKTKQDGLREAVKDYEWLLSYRERRQYIKN